MTTHTLIGCAAIVAGTVALVVAFTEGARPGTNRPAIAVGTVVGALLLIAGIFTVAAQVGA